MPSLQEVIDYLTLHPDESDEFADDLGEMIDEIEPAPDHEAFFGRLVQPHFKAENEILVLTTDWMRWPKATLPLAYFLNKIIPMVSDSQFVSLLAKWLAMPSNQALADELIQPMLTSDNFDFSPTNNDELKAVQNLCKNKEDRAKLITGWLMNSKNDLSEEVLKKLLTTLHQDIDLIKSIAQWASNKTNSLDRFKTIVEISHDNIEMQKSIIEEWTSHNITDNVNLCKALPYLNSDENRNTMVYAWFYHGNNKMNIQSLLDILPQYNNPVSQSELASNYLRKMDCEYDSLLQIIPFLQGRDRTNFVANWVRNVKHYTTLSQIYQIMSLLENWSDQKTVIKAWSENPRTEGSADDFEKLETPPPTNKRHSLSTWISEKGAQCDEKNLEKILSFIDLHYETPEIEKLIIVTKWFHAKKIDDEIDSLISTLTHLRSRESKLFLCEAWLISQKTHAEDMLVKLLSVFDSISMKGDLIVRYFHHFESNRTDALLTEIFRRIKDPNDKQTIGKSILDAITDQESKIRTFITLGKLGVYGEVFDYWNIIYEFRLLGTEANTDDQFLALCRGLYDHYEFAQVDFLEYMIEHLPVADETILIKKLATTLKEDDSCFQLLEFGLDKYYLEDTDVLLIAKGRLSSNYASLTSLLDRDLISSLKPGELDNLQSIFGDPLPGTLSWNTLKLSDLFSYYDIKKQLNIFKQKIKPQILHDIIHHYTPPLNLVYITSNEQTKLSSLGIPQLPKMTLLSGYLQSKLPTLPTIEESMVAWEAKDQIKEQDPPDWQNAFKTLINAQDPAANEVCDFFRMISGQSLIGEEDKLFELFRDLKKELTFLFSKKNGISDYLSVLFDIGHGCVANITMKTRIYVYKELFKDLQDQYLYPFFCEKIVTPFFSTGDKLGGSTGDQADIFKNNYLLEAHLSPSGLIAGLSETFYRNGKIQADPSTIFKKFLNQQELMLINDNLLEATPEKTAQIASYLILREVKLPSSSTQLGSTETRLVDNHWFKDIKNEYERWFKDLPRLVIN